MDPRKESLVLEKAEPDGECSFNSFVLGWSTPKVLNRIDTLQPPRKYPSTMLSEFITESARVLGAALSWRSVKLQLLFLRQNDKIKLQKSMAPVFRRFSINLARHNEEFRVRTEEHLKGAFLDFIMPPKKRVADDVYSRHRFIKEKFAELNPVPRRWFSFPWSTVPKPPEPVLAEALNKLMKWWFNNTPDGGYEKFLHAMEQAGEWAGDIELDLLADFFDLNIDVRRQNFIYQIHCDHGVIEKTFFSDAQIDELRRRRVVEDSASDKNVLRFLPMTEQELIARISAVPHCLEIQAFIRSAKTLSGEEVPAIWRSSFRQLIQRDIINYKGENCFFNSCALRLVHLLEEFPGKENMLRLWRFYYINRPTITLVNEDAIHWDNLSSVTLQEERDSFKHELAVFIAANLLYIILLKRLEAYRFSIFSTVSHDYLPAPVKVMPQATIAADFNLDKNPML